MRDYSSHERNRMLRTGAIHTFRQSQWRFSSILLYVFTNMNDFAAPVSSCVLIYLSLIWSVSKSQNGTKSQKPRFET